MTLLRPTVALLTASLLLVGCEANKPASSSDNAVPPYTATAADAANAAALASLNVIVDTAATAHSESGFPIFKVPTGKMVALWAPFKGDAGSIPFPVDLLFNGTSDGTLNIPLSGSAEGFYTANSYPQEKTPPAAVLADPMVALNTQDGFSTTANMAIRFSAAIDTNTLPSGIRVFQMKGNTHAGFALTGVASDVARELSYGVDFVLAPDPTGQTVVIQPIKPLKSSTTYRVVVTSALKGVDSNSVVAYGAYQAQRLGVLALFPQVPLYEKAVAAYTAVNPFPPLLLKGMDPAKLVTEGGAIFPLVAGAQTPANPAGNIALSYSITTQNLTAALAQAQGVVAAAAAPIIAVGALPASVNTPVTAGFQATNTQIYVGAVSGMTSFLNPADPVHSVWSNAGNNLSPANLFKPDANATKVTVPVLVTAPDTNATVTIPNNAQTSGSPYDNGDGTATIPCGMAFPGGYPVVIFQHGITSNRGTMLALAGALTKTCSVGVAIDLPEHGILPTDSKFGFLAKTAANGGVSLVGPTGERLVASGAGMPSASNPAGCLADQAHPNGISYDVTGSNGWRCAAGNSYINLTNLANSRDVLRQSVIGLDSLYRALKSGANVGLPTINTDKISFVGMSLGSIVGETFVATLGNIGGSLSTAAFNVGGGGIAKLLDGSPSFRPAVVGGLAQALGAQLDDATYQSFLIAAQTLVDSADPINYTSELHALTLVVPPATAPQTPILFQEVVGTTTNPADLVVPNNVYGGSPDLVNAWVAVSGSTQTGWLAGQNAVLPSPIPAIALAPSALGGADSLVQGTSFLSLAQAAAGNATAAGCVLAYGPLCPAISGATSGAITPFTGIGLPQVNSDGKITVASGTPAAPTLVPAPYGVVRFTSGTHSSLLDPSAAASQTPSGGQITVMMQTQIAAFLAGRGVVGETACGATCAGTIANW